MSTNPLFDIGLKQVLKWEGSKFTNDPNDRGGATRYGIIQTVYDTYRIRKGVQTDTVKNIEMTEVSDIYYGSYWIVGKCDKLPAKLSICHFDATVNHGSGNSAKFLQRALGVTVDGKVGPNTLNKANSMNVEDTIAKYLSARIDFYHAIVDNDPSQAKWLKGWLNRVADLDKLLKTV